MYITIGSVTYITTAWVGPTTCSSHAAYSADTMPGVVSSTFKDLHRGGTLVTHEIERRIVTGVGTTGVAEDGHLNDIAVIHCDYGNRWTVDNAGSWTYHD